MKTPSPLRILSGKPLKNAYAKDILRAIAKSKKRFFAIMAITALGLTTFVGIYAACRDMYFAADKFYDNQGLFDIQVLSTLGITQDDVTALQAVPGVAIADGVYKETVRIIVGDLEKTADMVMLSAKGINMPYVVEGRLPESAGEVALTQKYINASGKSIGDKIEIEEDFEEDDEDDDEEDSALNRAEADPNFKNTTYKITGIVIDPMEISNTEGTAAFRASSKTDYTFFITPMDVETDIYTSVYITLRGLSQLDCYSDEYENAVQSVISYIEDEIIDQREKARYENVMLDAIGQISSAEADINKSFLEAENQFANAWDDINKARQSLLDGEIELSKQESEMLAAFSKARDEIADGRIKLSDAQLQLSNAYNKIQSGLMDYEAGIREYNEGLIQYEANKANIAALESSMTNIPSLLGGMQLLILGYGPSLMSDPGVIGQFSAATWGLTSILDGVEGFFTSAGQGDLASMVAGISGGVKMALAGAGLTNDYEAVYNTAAMLNSPVSGASTPYMVMLGAAKSAADEIEAAKTQLGDAKTQLDNAKCELDDGLAQYNSGIIELSNSRMELDKSEARLNAEEARALSKISAARQAAAAGRKELYEGEAELKSSEADYLKQKSLAQEELAQAYAGLDDIDMTKWYVQSRRLIDSYSGLDTDLTSINVIGKAFPVLFLVVTVLISLTTMTRMVEEERGLIGTYKAQGFSNVDIAMKYIIYAVLASAAGSVFGSLLGFILLPKLLIIILGYIYKLPNITLHFDILYGTAGTLLFMVSIVLAVALSCMNELRQTPAALMRPRTPKEGSRIFLERIPVIWERFDFLNKVTARNLFRYKKRLFMTIIGIAGCTALVLMGFAIRDSVTDLMPKQYEGIYRYDIMAVAKESGHDKLVKLLNTSHTVLDYISVRVESIKLFNGDGESLTMPLIVIPDGASLEDYVNTPDKNGDTIPVESSGVIVTINASELLDINKNDIVTIQTLGLSRAEVFVNGVVENFLGNNVFMTENRYEQLFGEYKPTAIYARLDPDIAVTVADHAAFSSMLLDEDYVISSISIEQKKDEFSEDFALLNYVIYILIGLAAGLAFIVLFTLATTNISERERELATIKVLGFFDREVYSYVNKETLILTVFGVLAGLPLGYVASWLLLYALKMPSLHFVLAINEMSYALAAVISFTFALMVNMMTNRILDKINMVEALKSVE